MMRSEAIVHVTPLAPWYVFSLGFKAQVFRDVKH